MAIDPPPYIFENFAGYQYPNTTQIPNEFFDFQMPFLSGAEIKVMLYIFRRTLGFRRMTDNISLNQMLDGITRHDGSHLDYGTNLSRSALVTAIKSLVEKRLIIQESHRNKDGGFDTNTYSLHFAPPPRKPEEDPGNKSSTPTGNGQGGSPKIELGGGAKIELPPSTKIELPPSTKIELTKDSIRINSVSTDSKTVVVGAAAELIENGIAPGVAESLAAAFAAEAIRDKIAYLAFLRKTQPGKVQNPAGWLRRAIEQDFSPPDGFGDPEFNIPSVEEYAAIRARQEDAARAQAEQQAARRAALRTRYSTPNKLTLTWETVLRDLKDSGQNWLYQEALTLEAVAVTDGALTIAAPSQLAIDKLRHPGATKQLQRSLKAVTQITYTFTFVVAEELATP